MTPYVCLELMSRLELPNLILTKDALYHLSYISKYMGIANKILQQGAECVKEMRLFLTRNSGVSPLHQVSP